MINSKKSAEAQNEGLRALEVKYDQLIAERKSIYNIIDKLSSCIEETNRRFDQIISQVEALENRITDIEIWVDSQKKEEEIIDETG